MAANSLFEIENHGFAHKPCSVSARSVYGIKGTADVGEVVDEVEKEAEELKRRGFTFVRLSDYGLK